jgi:hypothetical protein
MRARAHKLAKIGAGMIAERDAELRALPEIRPERNHGRVERCGHDVGRCGDSMERQMVCRHRMTYRLDLSTEQAAHPEASNVDMVRKVEQVESGAAGRANWRGHVFGEQGEQRRFVGKRALPHLAAHQDARSGDVHGIEPHPPKLRHVQSHEQFGENRDTAPAREFEQPYAVRCEREIVPELGSRVGAARASQRRSRATIRFGDGTSRLC